MIQEDSTQKEDDVGAAASTEENVQQEIPEISSEVLQQEIPEISSEVLQQEESRKGESDKTEGTMLCRKNIFRESNR